MTSAAAAAELEPKPKLKLSADFILTLIHHRGGKIKYSELVNVFEAGLYHAAPDLRDRNRKHFKDVLAKVAFIIEEERTKYVILKPAWDGAFGVEENSLSAFVDDSKGSIDTDFPDKDPANVLEWWFLDPSTRVVTEGALLEDEKDDRSSCIPAIMITQADEKKRKAELKMCDTWEDLNCLIQSLRSETSSLLSEVTATVSVKSGNNQEDIEDDLQSVTTSSVTLDPLEHDWIRFAAMGNTAALTDLLLQDPALASKKDFNSGTALHWAAKHGKEEMAETIARAGIDVNVKSHGGYTPLHIAALHGHRHIIQLLINTYNAKANIRDYYGKMPMHYWKGNEGLFEPAFSQSCSKVAGEDRRAQKCVRFRSGRSCSQSRTQMESLPCPDMTVQDKKQALMGKGCSLSCASN